MAAPRTAAFLRNGRSNMLAKMETIITTFWRKTKLAAVASVCLAISGFTAPAAAEIPQVDGKLWMESTTDQKQAYLVGVVNLLAVSQALREKRGTADASDPMARYLAAADTQSIAQIQARLDSYYANSANLSVPVLGALWRASVAAR